MITLKGNSAIYEGLSTDSKPTTGIDVNTLFHELDTNKWYYFTSETWAEVPNTGGGGGGGFTPTQTQLDAMNSGITTEGVEQIGENENNISNIQTTLNSFHKASGTNIYFQEDEPTGTIVLGSYWISSIQGVKTYSRTAQLYNKNGIDTTNGFVNNAWLYNTGEMQTNNDQYEVSEYIEVDADTQYTLDYGTNLNSPSICYYDSSKAYISGNNYSGQNPITITTPTGATYCRISVIKSKKDVTMLNQGSTTAAYAPYYDWT